jgi:UDP-N-acetylmuramoyl-tripeptide--D-alanyl-D-alanine ligase
MEIAALYKLYCKSRLVCTDTRTISPGCIFFALRGDNFDGNAYAAKALASGASYAVIDNASFRLTEKYILVPDVLEYLQKLARYHRQQLNIPVIGITGSNGKTTSKELINSVLSQKFNTYATRGNLNNHIGVPLTLLSIGLEVELAIIEMGANHQKEIELLCNIARPTHGLITNIGKAHLEGFGGIDGVKKGKGELYDWLSKYEGHAFVNKDNPILMGMVSEKVLKNIIYYNRIAQGSGSSSLVSGELTANDPFLKIKWQPNEDQSALHTVQTQLTGNYNLENILAAACIGTYFELSPSEINKGLVDYAPANNRSQVTVTANNTLICDYYNANPSSMFVALDNFASLKNEKKVLILGDMFELGDEAASEHQLVLNKAQSILAEKRIFIGQHFFSVAKVGGSANYAFQSTDEAVEFLKLEPIKGFAVLIKGSRSMRLEKLVELL